MNDLVGQQLGNYRIIRLLGKGGFADVYLAEHIHLLSFVAIKVLYNQRFLTDEDFEQFRAEARTIINLTHPHIMRIIDFGLEDNIVFMVIEYAPNGTIRDLYPRGTKVPLAKIVNYVMQVASALQYAHDRRIIHRDVKPDNMLLNAENELLLSDFGIATIAQNTRSQVSQDRVGTPYYMAPEQFKGHPSPASDQYSLGIVVYEWLTGSPPFAGREMFQIGFQHLYEPISPIRKKNPAISLAVEQTVIKALEKDPHQRFPNIMAFATALGQAAQLSSASDSLSKIVTPTQPPNPPNDNSTQVYSPDDEAIRTYTVPWDKSSPSLQGWETSPPLRAFANDNATSPPEKALDEKEAMDASIVPATNNEVSHVQEKPRDATVVDQTPMSPVDEQWNQTINPSPTIMPRDPSLLLSIQSYVVSLLPTVNAPQGTKGTVGQGTTISIWQGHVQEVYAVTWSSDGRFVASAGADETVQIWEPSTKRRYAIYRANGKVYALAWSLDGQYIAAAGKDKTVQIWNVATARKHFSYSVPGEVYTLAWSPDGRCLATGGTDRLVHVWDIRGRSELCTLKGHSDWIRALAWSPNSKRIVSASNDQTLDVWNIDSCAVTLKYKKHSDWVRAVAWSPDGKYIASTSSDKTAQVWDATTGKTIRVYRGHASSWMGEVLTVAWSPDGQCIASSGEDQTVQVWNPKTGTLILSYGGHFAPVDALAWSPDGQKIASGSYDKTVQIWQAMEVVNKKTVGITQLGKTVQ